MKQGVDKKLIVKKSLIYFAAIWIGLILPAILGVEAESPWLLASSSLVFAFIFFDIGRSMKSKVARKQYIVYLVVFFVPLFLVILLSTILDTERLDPWFSLIEGNVIMGAIAGIIIHLAKKIRSTHPKISSVLTKAFFLLALMLLLVNIATIVGMFMGESV